MSTQLKRRRGTQAENDAFTGAEGEIVAITDEKRIALHDAATAGGHLFLNSNDIFNNEEKYALAGGTANALTVAFAGFTISTGGGFYIKASATNTGAATLNLNSGGAVNILKSDSASGTLTSLDANDLIIGGLYLIGWNGANFILMGSGAGAEAASDSEIASESAVDKYIRPDRLLNSPRVASCWFEVSKNFSNVPTLVSESFNVASMTYSGSGNVYRATFDDALPNANYVPFASVLTDSAATPSINAKNTAYVDVNLPTAEADYSFGLFTTR